MITRIQAINNKYKLINKAIIKTAKVNSDFYKVWQQKAIELMNFRWTLSFESAEQKYSKYKEHYLKVAGIKLKVLGGNKEKVYTEVYDDKTNKAITWGELIERMNGRK